MRVEGEVAVMMELLASVTPEMMLVVVMVMVRQTLLLLDLGQDGRQSRRRGILRLLVLRNSLTFWALSEILLVGLLFGVFPLGVLVEVSLRGEGLGALAAVEALPVGAVSASHLQAKQREEPVKLELHSVISGERAS